MLRCCRRRRRCTIGTAGGQSHGLTSRQLRRLHDRAAEYQAALPCRHRCRRRRDARAPTLPAPTPPQALRGIALVMLERGDRHEAMAQYERILGKAALGRGPAEHWAHADYGWLLFQEGDLQVGGVGGRQWGPAPSSSLWCRQHRHRRQQQQQQQQQQRQTACASSLCLTHVQVYICADRLCLACCPPARASAGRAAAAGRRFEGGHAVGVHGDRLAGGPCSGWRFSRLGAWQPRCAAPGGPQARGRRQRQPSQGPLLSALP